MLRCLSSNLRLTPLCKAQPQVLLRPSLRVLKPTQRSFSSTPSFARQKLERDVPNKKNTDTSDVKKLFGLAKPESKRIAGNKEILNTIPAIFTLLY